MSVHAVDNRRLLPVAGTPVPGAPIPGALWWLMAVSALLRLCGAAVMGLGVDESYAVAVARPVSASYFDHPPMVFWITALVDSLVRNASPLALRAPFIALFALTTFAIFDVGRTLYGTRAGLFGALVLNLCGVLGFSDASWILPDGPLLCGLSVAAMAFARICFDGGGDGADGTGTHHSNHARWWLLVGLGAGFAGLSKYHAIFFPIGALSFLVVTRRMHLLRSPWPWIAGAIAVAMVSPVIYWNATHDWASLRFQIGRAGASSPGFRIDPFLQIVAGQIGYVLPWVWIPMVWATWRAFTPARRNDRSWFLLLLAAGPILVFTLVTLGGSRGLPHWQGPGYLFLTPLLGAALADRMQYGLRWPRTWMRSSAIAIVLLATVVVTQSAFGWVSRALPSAFTKGDPSLEAMSWDAIVPALESQGVFADTSVAFVAASHWIEAGKLGAAIRGRLPVVAIIDDPRGFQFAQPLAKFRARNGLLVRRQSTTPVDTTLRGHFDQIDMPATVPIVRAGVRVFDLEVYRVRGLRE